MSAEDIDELRRKRARELLEAMDNDDKDGLLENLPEEEILPWSYRFGIMGHNEDGSEIGAFQILQQGQVIAMTQDQQFAEMVTDYLNRMILVMSAGMMDLDEIHKSEEETDEERATRK